MDSKKALSLTIVRSARVFLFAPGGLRHKLPGKGRTEIGADVLPRLVPATTLVLLGLIFLPMGQDVIYGERVQQATLGSLEKSKPQSLKKSNLIEMERLILNYTNEEREGRGLKPLAFSPALKFLARSQSRHMCSTGEFQHESKEFPKGWRRFRDRLQLVSLKSGGENIAYRTFSGESQKWAREIIKGWMKSPNHRRNILSSEFNYLGAGVAPCSNRIVYATQVFSSKPGTVPRNTAGLTGSLIEGRFESVAIRQADLTGVESSAADR